MGKQRDWFRGQTGPTHFHQQGTPRASLQLTPDPPLGTIAGPGEKKAVTDLQCLPCCEMENLLLICWPSCLQPQGKGQVGDRHPLQPALPHHIPGKRPAAAASVSRAARGGPWWGPTGGCVHLAPPPAACAPPWCPGGTAVRRWRQRPPPKGRGSEDPQKRRHQQWLSRRRPKFRAWGEVPSCQQHPWPPPRPQLTRNTGTSWTPSWSLTSGVGPMCEEACRWSRSQAAP